MQLWRPQGASKRCECSRSFGPHGVRQQGQRRQAIRAVLASGSYESEVELREQGVTPPTQSRFGRIALPSTTARCRNRTWRCPRPT